MENRKLKFRAWDEKQKYMAYQGTPDLETIQSFMHQYSDKPLMQFTGLETKALQDIYEGDLMKCDDGWFTGVVSWSNEKGCFVFSNLGGCPNIIKKIDEGYLVIGNIFEEGAEWSAECGVYLNN